MSSTNTNLLEVRNLWKHYFLKTALHDLSFEVSAGKFVGVLGENGSGKTTLLKILAGVMRPSEGHVQIQQQPLGLKTRQITAYLPDVDPYYRDWTLRRLLDFFEPFYPSWDSVKANHLLDFLGLEESWKVGGLSKGQRAKIKLVCSFSWKSRLVLLDEPLNSIDPVARDRIVAALKSDFCDPEQTVLLTSHLVKEVEPLFEDVIFLRYGKITLSGNREALQEEHQMSLLGLFEKASL